MRTTRRPLASALAILAAATLLAACGSSAGSDGSVRSKGDGDGAATTTTVDDSSTATEPASGSDSGSGSSEAPSIPETPAKAEGCRTGEDATAETKAPKVDPPTKDETSIRVVDDIPGCGELVTSSSTVKVQYVLVAKSSGQIVDSSWSRNEPFDVGLGQGQVISGWDLGIPGMRVGGRRTLFLGPDYGYGAQGAGGDIAPNDTLVFTIDALSVS